MVGTLSFCPPYDPPETELPLSPNLRGSLLMAVAMAGFTMNDSITKLMSSEMNFGQVMLVRGLFAICRSPTPRRSCSRCRWRLRWVLR
jgi:hypothetical protein